MLHDAWVEARQELTVTDQDSQDMWKLYADLADVLFQGFQDQLKSVRYAHLTSCVCVYVCVFV